jgi:hypothetical protein
MSRAQREYFLHWRGEFRRGRIIEAPRGYRILYARELILAMGGEAPPVYFRELLRLKRSFPGETPDYPITRWLIDFAVLYGIAGEVLPELFPLAGDTGNELLGDLFIHKKYVEGDNPVSLADLGACFSGRIWKEFQTGGPEQEGYKKTEAALRRADGYLRKKTGKKIFEFFYPSRAVWCTVEGFRPFTDLGHSSYTAEWIRFPGHKPLRDFLDSLADYTLRGIIPGESPGPIAAAALGFPETSLPPGLPGTSGGEGRSPGDLRPDLVARIRDESDHVRELLRIQGAEEAGPDRGAAPVQGAVPDTAAGAAQATPPPAARLLRSAEGACGGTGAALPPRGGGGPAGAGGFREFLAGLGAAERETLAFIAAGEDRRLEAEAIGAGLGEIARRNLTMPELLIDGINETFQGTFGDLLVDSLDGVPVIHTEYGGALRGALKGRRIP